MKFRLGSFILLLLFLYLQSCTPSGDGESGQQKLTLTGASTVAPLVSALGKRFEEQNPGIRIDVQTGGSSRGLADVQQGLSDIGMVSRTLTAEEAVGMEVFLLGRDGISIIIHADNPLTEINSKQVKAISTGQIQNWQSLNKIDAPITFVHRAEGHSTLKKFLEYFGVNNSQVKADVVIGDNQQGIKTVAGNPNAIGYVSIGAAEYSMQEGVSIKLLALDGVEATSEAVANGRFPLLRQLTLVTKGQPTGLAKQFIAFVQGEENYDIIRLQKFVPPEN
ncbi:phosphate ABC transporter substrate-binding protein [Okeania sp. SIO2B3]|uniref:phosphate ABC transporter substrate-binding protein n=1 Tax=Okeania sp. SIO2B3 TaxID=2607784 RepID=UPI0013BFB434|nr:phosphate ABC transporter substrate-binding protein [Okeania sp. SIO2B3]NET44466.1 phosphate ABC transporter substrate-binding protein [Okeania sp. SIO2B3]